MIEAVPGRWVAHADSLQGKVRCTRTIGKVLDGKFIQLVAGGWIGKLRYEETALSGVKPGGRLGFRPFTLGGEPSGGKLVQAREVHPEAFGFEVKMSARIGRMIYGPADGGGFHWAVEVKTKRGWRRFTEHHHKQA